MYATLITAGPKSKSSIFTTIDVLSVQCLELLLSIFLHSCNTALSPDLYDIVLQMCQIDRIVHLLSDQIVNRSSELKACTNSVRQASEDMPISDEHEFSSVTTLASMSDADGRTAFTAELSPEVVLCDKMSVIKASLSFDHCNVMPDMFRINLLQLPYFNHQSHQA